ncbi:circadian clock KaiB family protein [Hymenobacter sp. BT186]|uniref:Circadian clock KaiB family protein n=1 Tax=Hymenobacter telluris TaxID=2816474 RepID=A0A939EZL0_9BACT|nr:circadian clock KaiB family protein [Hymenobacter telluris]MBO0359527.1 circadian clock KaiB family protein [Hymenobacter telluris]MBW3375553.1 circadian clock KaiB family protein [Hymenobacter norwichensis]
MEVDENPPFGEKEYLLHLYIAGATPNSTKAVRNIKEICELYLEGRHELLIIDIYQQPELAQGEQLIGIPTLIKKRPGLIRRLVGDLSDRPRVLAALGLPATPPR